MGPWLGSPTWPWARLEPSRSKWASEGFHRPPEAVINSLLVHFQVTSGCFQRPVQTFCRDLAPEKKEGTLHCRTSGSQWGSLRTPDLILQQCFNCSEIVSHTPIVWFPYPQSTVKNSDCNSCMFWSVSHRSAWSRGIFICFPCQTETFLIEKEGSIIWPINLLPRCTGSPHFIFPCSSLGLSYCPLKIPAHVFDSSRPSKKCSTFTFNCDGIFSPSYLWSRTYQLPLG